MKKILFDLTMVQPVNGSKYHGGGIYGKVVFRKLAEISPERLSVYYNPNIFIDDDILQIIKDKNIKVYLSNELSVTEAAKKEGKIIYSPLVREEYLKDDSLTKIVTIHGLRTLEMTDDENQYLYFLHKNSMKEWAYCHVLGGLKRLYDRTIKTNKEKARYSRYFSAPNMRVITVSNHSKSSIKTFFPNVDEDRLRVYFSPDTTSQENRVDAKPNKCGKYYLLVSGNRWLKNCIRAIKALDELFTERPDFESRVVVTGLKDLSYISVKINNPDRFECVGYVDTEELTNLYRNAYLFVYPTLNEGFGYPPLEAMHEGCPVACSAIASVPEVCGDAVLYFSPYSISEIKNRILQMEDTALRNEYIQRGFKQQRKINDKQVSDLMELCQYILSFAED